MKQTRKDQHVVPHGGRWAVRGEGNARATKVYRTQREAIAAARALARRHGGETLVHARDGTIRARDTTAGNDPMPPRG